MSYTLLDIASDLISGDLEIASPDVAEQRITICNGCEILNTIRQCTACGCMVDLKTKLHKSECPLGYW